MKRRRADPDRNLALRKDDIFRGARGECAFYVWLKKNGIDWPWNWQAHNQIGIPDFGINIDVKSIGEPFHKLMVPEHNLRLSWLYVLTYEAKPTEHEIRGWRSGMELYEQGTSLPKPDRFQPAFAINKYRPLAELKDMMT